MTIKAINSVKELYIDTVDHLIPLLHHKYIVASCTYLGTEGKKHFLSWSVREIMLKLGPWKSDLFHFYIHFWIFSYINLSMRFSMQFPNKS